MSRSLSAIEHTNWIFDKVASVTFVMVARVTGGLTESILRRALDILQEKFPALKWKIRDGDVPEFITEGVPKIPLRVIEKRDEGHWIEEAEKEMDKRFPWTEGPLLRVVQLVGKNECDLLVTLCHVATDAASGVLVIKEMLDISGKLCRGETVSPPIPLREPPPAIQLIRDGLEFDPAPPDQPDSSQDSYSAVELPGDQDVPPHQRTTRIISRMLSKEETKALVVRCKKEKTSVHAALCAALFQSVVAQARKLQDVPQEGPLSIGCLTPVDIRQYFDKLIEGDIGYYISFAIHHQLIDDQSALWPAAQNVKKALMEELKYGKDIEAIRNVGAVSKEGSPVDMVRDVNKTLPSVVASNMGRANIEGQFGDLTLERLHYVLTTNIASRDGLATAVMTHQGCLTVNFLYAEPYVSERRAAIIADNTMKRLQDAVS